MPAEEGDAAAEPASLEQRELSLARSAPNRSAHNSICLSSTKLQQQPPPSNTMKSFVVAVAALAALTSQASAASCSSATLSALLTDQYIDQCASDSGYVFTAASIPDQATIDKMCASAACKGLLADAQALNLEECTLPVGDHINLRADLVDYVPAHCPSTDSPATDAPATDGPATDAPATDAPTTDAPASSDSPATPAPTTTTAKPSTPTAC